MTTENDLLGSSGKTILEDTSEEIYSDGEYADYSYFNGNNNEFLASYVDDAYTEYDTPARGDPVSHFAPQLPVSVVRSLTQIGNIKSVAFDNRSAKNKTNCVTIYQLLLPDMTCLFSGLCFQLARAMQI